MMYPAFLFVYPCLCFSSEALSPSISCAAPKLLVAAVREKREDAADGRHYSARGRRLRVGNPSGEGFRHRHRPGVRRHQQVGAGAASSSEIVEMQHFLLTQRPGGFPFLCVGRSPWWP